MNYQRYALGLESLAAQIRMPGGRGSGEAGTLYPGIVDTATLYHGPISQYAGYSATALCIRPPFFYEAVSTFARFERGADIILQRPQIVVYAFEVRLVF
jgi:hypothetical protein